LPASVSASSSLDTAGNPDGSFEEVIKRTLPDDHETTAIVRYSDFRIDPRCGAELINELLEK